MWRVLPQGMLNSPTLCQHFNQQPLDIICKKFLQSPVYHYMDDILSSDSNKETVECMFELVKEVLPHWGLQIFRLQDRLTKNKTSKCPKYKGSLPNS